MEVGLKPSVAMKFWCQLMEYRLPILLVCLLFTARIEADERGVNAALTSEDRQSAVLVLTDGTVLETSLRAQGGGYSVEVAGGRQFIESSRVRFLADDRVDAWRQMRASFQELTPEVHLQLARWCLKNGLPKQAEREALDALRLDPHRQDAKRMLEQLAADGAGRGGRQSAASNALMPPLPAAGAAATARSLAGLRRVTAQQFVRSVQPLLSSKCATGGCHGRNSESEFQLLSVRNGSDPRTAEQNLLAVLKQVSFSEPSQSALLQQAGLAHGGATELPLRGRSGVVQMQTLRQWVLAAAADLAPGENRELAESAEAEQVVPPVAETTGSGPAEPADLPEETHGRLQDGVAVDREFLAEAKRSLRNDPFDPAVFNRRHHGDRSEQ